MKRCAIVIEETGVIEQFIVADPRRDIMENRLLMLVDDDVTLEHVYKNGSFVLCEEAQKRVDKEHEKFLEYVWSEE